MPSEHVNRLIGYLESDPGNYPLTLDIVQILCNESEFDSALMFLGKLGKEHHSSIEYINWCAFLHLAKQDYNLADKFYRELVQIEGCDPSLLINAALVSYQLGDWLHTLSLFERVELESVAHILLFARTLYNLGNIEQAVEVLSVIESETGDYQAEVFGVLSMLHSDSGDYQTAEKYALQATQLQPEQFDAMQTVASLALFNADTAKADLLLLKLLEREPRNGRALALYALSLMYQKDYQTSLIQFKKATEILSDHAGTHVNMAWCQFACEDYRAAEACFYKAVKIDRSFAEGHGGLAVMDMHFERTEQAKRKVKLALRINAECPSALYAKALIIKSEGDEEASTALIEKLLSYSSDVSGSAIRNIVNLDKQ